MKEKDYNSNEPKIQIRKKNKYLCQQGLLKILAFIVIAGISGSVTAKIIVDKSIAEFNSNENIDKIINSNGNLLQNQISEGITKASNSIVTVSDKPDNLERSANPDSNITGVIVDKDGYILTNLSGIENYEKIYVKLPSVASKAIEAKYIGGQKKADLALIKIQYDDLTPITIAEEDSFREGDFVVALGNVIADDFIGIAIPGIITSTNDTINIEELNESYGLIQTSAKITKDNTGGVLCNVNGELVGLSSMKLSNEFRHSDLSYAIGVRGVKGIISQLLNLIDILGINRGSEINDVERGIEGVYIDNLDPNGYAAKSGVKPTDIIISINNKTVKTSEDIFYELKDKKNGDTVTCEILRDGKKMTIYIKLN